MYLQRERETVILKNWLPQSQGWHGRGSAGQVGQWKVQASSLCCKLEVQFPPMEPQRWLVRPPVDGVQLR